MGGYSPRLRSTKRQQLAEFFDVSETTINNWKKQHPEFLVSIRAGKAVADAEIANALYHRANGYSHPDTDIRVIDQKIVKTEIIKHYPPDPKFCIFWLKNRQKMYWRDNNSFDHAIDAKVEVNDESDRLDTAKRVAFLLQKALKAKEKKEGEISRS